MNEREILIEIEKMEAAILTERRLRGNKGRSSFSYHLYAHKLEGYQSREDKPDKQALKARLQDIITQHRINVEDNPFDDEIRAWAMLAIDEAEEWMRQLLLTE